MRDKKLEEAEYTFCEDADAHEDEGDDEDVGEYPDVEKARFSCSLVRTRSIFVVKSVLLSMMRRCGCPRYTFSVRLSSVRASWGKDRGQWAARTSPPPPLTLHQPQPQAPTLTPNQTTHPSDLHFKPARPLGHPPPPPGPCQPDSFSLASSSPPPPF